MQHLRNFLQMLNKSFSYNHLGMLTLQLYETISNLHYMNMNNEEDTVHENLFSH